MPILILIAWILAFANPVIGGVLFGYLVWVDDKNYGFSLIVLSLTLAIVYIAIFLAYQWKKYKKKVNALESKVKELENKKNDENS